MKVAERIRIIRLVADYLSKYDYGDIDLILRQFNLPTTSTWSGEKRDYVISMIDGSTDETLVELHEFLIDEISDRAVVPSSLAKSVEQCWEQGVLHLFISHSSKDKKEVTELKKILSTYQIACFVAHEDIITSEEWEKELVSGLDSCHALVAWVTQSFNESAYAQQEVGIALVKGKYVLPIRRGVNPQGFISKIQAAPNMSSIEDAALHIIDVLEKKQKTQKILRQALIKSFITSPSFADAQKRIRLLQKWENWEKDELRQLSESVNKNSQISGAYHVPKIIRQILENNAYSEAPEISIEDLPF